MSDSSSLSEQAVVSLTLDEPSHSSPSTPHQSPARATDPDASQSHTASPPTPALERLKSLLQKTLRVTILDGRIFIGTFVGTDKLLNVLLMNTDEYRLGGNRPNPHGRFVGLVMIPWRLVAKAEAQHISDQRVNPDPGVGLRGIVDRYDDEQGDEMFS